MYHSLFTQWPAEGCLGCFQVQCNFCTCVLVVIPHPPQTLLFTSHFQPACVLVFYISAILLSGYAIQTSTPALAPTKITFGHDNNKIQGSLYSEDGLFIPKSLHRKMQGPKPRAGLRTPPEGQKQCGWAAPEGCPSVISWGNQLTWEFLADDLLHPCGLCKMMSDDLECFLLVSAGFSLTLLTRISSASN